jgi:AcrR family transcriptional regulator
MAKDLSSLTSEELILRAALQCFLEKGFHGTTIRAIAARGGLSVPGMYHHFASKLDLLERLIDDTMDDLVEVTQNSFDAAADTPLARFDAVVEAHVRFHCERAEESFIGNSELRSLPEDALARTIAKRDRQQRIFDRVVQDGNEAGIFHVRWPREASRAIVTSCTAVAMWYRRDGALTPDEITAIYRELARNLVLCSAGSENGAQPASASTTVPKRRRSGARDPRS